MFSKSLTVDVFLNKEKKLKVAQITQDNKGVLHWEYDSDWSKYGYPLSPLLPLLGMIGHSDISAFLQNLLPEGFGFDSIIDLTSISRSDVLGFLALIGCFETSGALSFRLIGEDDTLAVKDDYGEISNEEMSERLRLYTRGVEHLVDWGDKIWLSVAGVQDKLNVFRHDGKIELKVGAFSSNTILKFDTGKTPHIAVNELFTMKLARNSGLSVAHVDFERYGGVPALVVDRFDREFDPENSCVNSLHVIDGCQACGLPPLYKYERQFGDGADVRVHRDGVSFKKLLSLPACNTQEYENSLIMWLAFNLINGNYDAHGKNISFFVCGSDLKIAPFYDLVNLEALLRNVESDDSVSGPHFDDRSLRNFAMSIGDWEQGSVGNFTNDISAYALADFADEFGIELERMQELMISLTTSVSDAIEKTKCEIIELYDVTLEEIEHIDLCIRVIDESIARLMPELLQIESMQDYI